MLLDKIQHVMWNQVYLKTCHTAWPILEDFPVSQNEYIQEGYCGASAHLTHIPYQEAYTNIGKHFYALTLVDEYTPAFPSMPEGFQSCIT